MTVSMVEASVEKLREEELEEARAIQSVMLPSEPLRAGAVRISHEFHPVDEVGGDFLDYFELSDGTVGLYLGDVSGKGLAAAMYAALAVGTLRGVHKTGQSPSAVLGLLNKRLLLRSLPRRHTAMQYAVFDPRSREMQIASAGMPGPLYLSGKGCQALELSGIPPGLLPEATYDVTTLRLQPGESLLFCTDGITEAFDPLGEGFGIERLVALCGKHGGASAAELLPEISRALGRFCREAEQHDDRTAAFFHTAGE